MEESKVSNPTMIFSDAVFKEIWCNDHLKCQEQAPSNHCADFCFTQTFLFDHCCNRDYEGIPKEMGKGHHIHVAMTGIPSLYPTHRDSRSGLSATAACQTTRATNSCPITKPQYTKWIKLQRVQPSLRVHPITQGSCIFYSPVLGPKMTKSHTWSESRKISGVAARLDFRWWGDFSSFPTNTLCLN